MTSDYGVLEVIADVLPGTVFADIAFGPPLNPPSADEKSPLAVSAVASVILMNALQKKPFPDLGSGRGHRVDIRTAGTPMQYLFSRSSVLAAGSVYWGMRLFGQQNKTISLAFAGAALYLMKRRHDKDSGSDSYLFGGSKKRSLKRVLANGRVTPGEVNFISRQPLPIGGSIQ